MLLLQGSTRLLLGPRQPPPDLPQLALLLPEAGLHPWDSGRGRRVRAAPIRSHCAATAHLLFLGGVLYGRRHDVG